MKKVLSTVAALGLVAGFASTASALDFSVKGYYDVIGTYTSQSSARNAIADSTGNNQSQGIATKTNTVGSENDASDAWYEHEFVIMPKLTVNDKISMNSKIWMAGAPPVRNSSSQTTASFDDSSRDNYSMYLSYLYMDYKSDIGLFRLGRQSAGMYFGDFLNVDSDGHRLRWYSNDLGGGFKLSGFVQKYTDNGEGSPSASEKDNDYDIYSFGGFTKSKDLTASLWLDYFRDKHTSGTTMTKTRFKGYYNQNFGNMHAMAEFAYIFGDTETAASTTDIDNLSIIAEFGMTMDKLDMSFMAFYATGDDNGTATDRENSVAMHSTYGLGSEFAPLTVLTNTDARMLTGEQGGGANAEMVTAGVIALVASADIAITEKMSLHGALGYAMAESEMAGFDDEYGIEVDLGLSYKLLDNLTYSADMGYLMAGDFFKGDQTPANTARDAEDVLLLTNAISMTF